ncbi:hypothetical protein KAR91_65800 [Candidatus Pacearchaeota archaeon]|nr:hypothetical protein [Candidatus Pacearchaeota archaeon]
MGEQEKAHPPDVKLKLAMPARFDPTPTHISRGIIPGHPFYVLRESRMHMNDREIDTGLLFDTTLRLLDELKKTHPTVCTYEYAPTSLPLFPVSQRICEGAYIYAQSEHLASKLAIVLFLIVPVEPPVLH